MLRTKPQGAREDRLQDNTVGVVSAWHRPTVLRLFPGLSDFPIVFLVLLGCF